jgi:hypothetical protein
MSRSGARVENGLSLSGGVMSSIRLFFLGAMLGATLGRVELDIVGSVPFRCAN